MSIFRRNKAANDHPAQESVGEAEVEPTSGPEEPALLAGPFDAAEIDSAEDGRLDLGALRIRGVGGMELRLEVDEQAQQVVGATAVIGESAVQLQVFAAPRTTGVWDDIRDEIAESIVSQGGTADEVRGELGRELRTRMPSAGPDGRTVFAPARFVGVDGPRWFLRAMLVGAIATDKAKAASFERVLRQVVVVRGVEPLPVREAVPLRLPKELAAQTGDGEEQQAAE